MSLTFSEGTEPKGNDSSWKVAVKTLMELRAGSIGGSSGGGGVFAGHGAPTVVPSTTGAIYIDADTGTQYQWFGGAWH